MSKQADSFTYSRFAVLRAGAALSGLALALALPTAAWAQAADQGAEDKAVEEIVVTGSLLRGAPPVGSNLISVGQTKLAEAGAATANELLATVPQVTNLFNSVPNATLAIAANQIQVARPNLRNLTGATSSSSSTLVLFNGNRIAPVGVTQNAIDPDLFPSIAIERVEIVTDGGSSTYGSDAVGGVINFITRKRFDGLKVQGRYGFADNYQQAEGGVMAGKDWGTGSLFVAYNYQHNDAIFGRDRDFIRGVDWLSSSLTPRGRQCPNGNVQMTASGVTNLYALPALTSSTPNVCDATDEVSSIPRSTRHAALVSLHQELASWLTVDLKGFYGTRSTTSFAPFRGSANVSGLNQAAVDLRPLGIPFVIPASFRNFYYQPVPGQSATGNQTVLFDLTRALGGTLAQSGSKFEEWGANAEFAASLNENWQLRTLFNYSRSTSSYAIQEINNSLLNAFASGPNSGSAASTVNFYNPGAGSSDAANIARLVNNERAGGGREELFNARAILDGTLFTLPGGDIRMAVGYEYMFDRFEQRISNEGAIGAAQNLAYSPYSRSVSSIFGELNVPVVGASNRSGLIYALTLSASARYDHYNDFGNTTNPKFGVNFKPVEWLGFRGSYSTSFNAPSPNDQLGTARNTASYFGFNAFVPPGVTPTANGVVALQGSNPGLKPQTAKTYSFGIDLDPMQGLHASANYYNVKFKNIISIPTPNAGIFANFPANVIAAPAGVPLATIQSFLNNSGAQGAATTLATVAAGCTNPAACPNVYELVDFRQGNYGTVKVQGLDFAINYMRETGFGSVDANLSGNYVLDRKSQTGSGAPVINELKATKLTVTGIPLSTNALSRLQLSASIGASIGDFRAQATLNHTSGYDVVRCDASTVPACTASTTGVPTASGLPQDRVTSFNTINLFFKYAVPAKSALLRDVELTVNVNNLFDTDPPVYRNIGDPGYANGFTLGRMIQFGISKKF